MLEWLIIGAGVHGVHLGVHLRARGVPADALCLLDPAPRPLAAWERRAAATGMRYLRSPMVHHLDVDPFALVRFAQGWRGAAPFSPPYDRPAVALFSAHNAALIGAHGLESAHSQARARAARRVPGGWSVETDRGALTARRLVLAMGGHDRLAVPGWAGRLVAGGADVRHVFDEGYQHPAPSADPRPWIVLGGGLSAVQTALQLRARGLRTVLLSRHALRERQFDSDPGWMGPRFLRGFEATRDPAARRALIAGARFRGSAPADALAALRAAEAAGGLEVHIAEHSASGAVPGGGLWLRAGERTHAAAGLVLCTGVEAARPGGALVDGLVESGLPCSACGFPLPSRGLEWAPGLHLMGPLAELVVGPAARNIKGARIAAERIAACA
jgi:hypothetical protein